MVPVSISFCSAVTHLMCSRWDFQTLEAGRGILIKTYPNLLDCLEGFRFDIRRNRLSGSVLLSLCAFFMLVMSSLLGERHDLVNGNFSGCEVLLSYSLTPVCCLVVVGGRGGGGGP